LFPTIYQEYNKKQVDSKYLLMNVNWIIVVKVEIRVL
jgi:hypothetical protein